ncbi:MAG: hypothetical protein KGZ83_19790 [Sulfuricella sp.]|nr:hypothetical protein [Sulfuricella sp.]
MDFPTVRNTVDRLLLEQALYAPLELLLAEGRLSFADYEAWRCGEIATLEELLAGNPARIRARLEQADHYAAALGLRAERREYPAWGEGTGRQLRISSDAALDDLCRIHYLRNANEVQLDLFMDNSGNVLVNSVVAALASRRAEEAATLLERLRETDPSHLRLGGLEALCAAAQRPVMADVEAETAFLEGNLTPLATAELGAAARDFLTPFWRRLGEALGERPFAVEMPQMHASYALARALDWAGVRQAVLAERTWRDSPLLRLRLAEALYHLGERREALAQWCLLCWDFPRDAERALAGGKLPDKELQPAWERYRDLDVEPEPDAPFFPAWLLLERPELRAALTAEDAPQTHPAGRAYVALHKLPAGAATLSEQTMALRLQLKQAHPGLFAIYLRTL